MLDQEVRVSPVLTIGPQVDEKKLEEIASEGFATVLNLSTKGEFDQLLSPKEEGDIVRELGMDYGNIPVSLRKIRPEDLDELCRVIASKPSPVYLHCRVGQRSSLVGFIFHAIRRNFTAQTIVKRAKKLGIRWRAPYVQELIQKYIQRTRPMREEILDLEPTPVVVSTPKTESKPIAISELSARIKSLMQPV